MRARLQKVGRRLASRYLPRKPPLALDYDPYDQQSCESKARRLLADLHREAGLKPVEICRRLLEIAEVSYPTHELAAEYFANLEITLADRPRLEEPGRIVIGLGPGRCGSTSLSAMLGTVPDSCCTHETPPPISWTPRGEQIAFHLKRFALLADHHALVSDVSHWWLNAIDEVFARFPDARAIGLVRDPEDCARSFMPVQGVGRGTFNPWAPPRNGLWRAGHWDASYPTYPLASYAARDPDRAKLELIRRYVAEYNQQLETLARRAPERIKLVRTEDLSDDGVQAEIFQFARARGRISEWRLNARGAIADGKRRQIKF